MTLPKNGSVNRQALEAVLDRFEQAWQSGTPPCIDDFLTETSVNSRVLLVELVRTDLEHRLKAGQPARVEDYLARFPELETAADDVIELIVAEYRFRDRLGQRPAVEDYLRRFQHCRSVLSARLTDVTVGEDTPCESSAATEADLPARLGRHVVEGEIARGGMGMVVRLRDEEFQRPLAMKVLLPAGMTSAELAERFLQEARLTGQLQHPAVPPVHELGHLPDGRPYFIMKLIKGQSLQQLLRERSGPDQELTRFLGIFEQVCQAVAYAHARGVIHRDLKPANVMVGAFGEVQVMDWGLAKELKDEGRRMKDESEQTDSLSDSSFILHPSSFTQAGAVMGTPAYMAPEQARGEVDSLDARCDVLGWVRYSAKSSPASRPLPAARATISGWRSAATCPMLTPTSTGAAPMPSWCNWPKNAWRPTQRIGRRRPGPWRLPCCATRRPWSSGCGRRRPTGPRPRHARQRNINAGACSACWRRRWSWCCWSCWPAAQPGRVYGSCTLAAWNARTTYVRKLPRHWRPCMASAGRFTINYRTHAGFMGYCGIWTSGKRS
jgi:hypothetical protein